MKVKNYLLTEEIGSGSFSTVYKAIDVADHNKVYAIKSMRKIPQNEEKAVRKQIQLLKQIQQKHVKNVVNYITDFKQQINNKWYIVFQYCGKGDLENYLKKQNRLPEIFCKNVASSVIQALSQLHQKGIAHRDLKLSNILINDQYDFKIADFGMAKVQKDGILQSYCGTPYAMAPQVLKRQSYDTKCDTWSLGIMIYQLIYGKLPFDGRKQGGGIFGLTAAVLQQQPYYNSTVKISEQCLAFIKLCLKKNPKDRPTMKQLASHPWLSVGVGSLIRKDFLKTSFQGCNIKDQVIKRTKQVINQSVHQHIKKLIKYNKLTNHQIGNMINMFQKFYKEQSKVKQAIILMILKLLKQLATKPIIIMIENKKFPIKMINVEGFKTHLKNLQSLLQQYLTQFLQQKKGDRNLQRQIISFVTNKANCCLDINQSYADQLSLLQYISKLPIFSLSNSTIYIKWQFNDVGTKLQQQFNDFIEILTEEQVYKFANEPFINEGGQKNWIIQHDFPRQRRQGPQFQIGQFIARVIQINCSSKQSTV